MLGTLPEYLRVLRVRSWIGWIFYYALGCLIFAMPSWNMVVISAALISATSGIFILNQCYDMACDRLHFTKKQLPIAAGVISSSRAFSLYILSTILSLSLVALTDISLIPLFAIYIGGGICYSVPPIRLKSRPVLDVIFVGLFSGILPLLIGLQMSHQLTLDLWLPWVRQYQDVLLVMMPLLLFQCSTHIFQAIGDYEADLDAGVRTSVVKYGKGKSVKMGKILLTTSLLFPLIFGVMWLSNIDYMLWYLIILLTCLPLILYFMKQKFSSKEKIGNLTAITKKAAPIIYTILIVAVFLIKVSLQGG
jgi:4-hydroxybenzoate polyprenyltransferase